ncbi:MAG: putative transcriptional regulator [Herbinix sp.]|jgi:DNA-binding transcriptional ArsR family regulator|nr:putative transcriptional regulator [Herbinix sp.]
MNIGICYDQDTKGEFSYSPLFEMLASLHVITKPEHHLERAKWMNKVLDTLPSDLIDKIRDLSLITNEWMIVMDFAHMNPYSDLTIPDALIELDKLGLLQWNKLFQSYQKRIDKEQRLLILRVMKDYYELLFQYEIAYLQPFLIRILKKEMEACKEEGLLFRLNQYHERLKVDTESIVFHKNKEYRFKINNLSRIFVTASTFISPHLLMHEDKGDLYVTMLVPVEEKKDIVPTDLVNLLKTLADETRLKILRELNKRPDSTQRLAIKLKITEAGVSKHLKLLYQVGLVSKHRQGYYIMYQLDRNAIDFLPYTLYEFIMR